MQYDSSLPEPLIITLQVTKVFEKLQVPYFIGGSLASAVHGTIRATMDADLIADLHIKHIQYLVECLEDTFYIDKPAIIDALNSGISFNLIHKETMFKVDIFPLGQRSFEQTQMQRRVLQTLSDHPDDQAYFATAEDIILAKLVWFRMGGEVSERQWRDVLGVMRVQGKQLDMEYLRLWADRLSLADLLERAYAEIQL